MTYREKDFQANWERFVGLEQTYDTLAKERIGSRRWRWQMPDIAFVLPVNDPVVVARCVAWQEALGQWFEYAPQPADRLHITLHYVGDLREYFWQWRFTTWRRTALTDMARDARAAFEDFEPFEVTVGPLNAFSTGLFAEIHDNGELDTLRHALKEALPGRAALLHVGRTYLPHITLGYWGHRPVAPLVDALQRFRDVDVLPLRIERVKFTIYSRDTIPLRDDVLTTAEEEVIAEYDL